MSMRHTRLLCVRQGAPHRSVETLDVSTLADIEIDEAAFAKHSFVWRYSSNRPAIIMSGLRTLISE